MQFLLIVVILIAVIVLVVLIGIHIIDLLLHLIASNIHIVQHLSPSTSRVLLEGLVLGVHQHLLLCLLRATWSSLLVCIGQVYL